MSKPTTHIAAENLKPERYLALLGIARSIASNRNLGELFQELACQLQGLFEFRDIGILLHDESQNVMRVQTLESCGPDSSQATFEVPVQGSVAGWVWQNQAPAVVSDLDKDTRFSAARNIREYPLKSICSLPLTTAQRRLGAFNFWSEWNVTPPQLSVDHSPNLANESIRRSFMYDGIQIFHPETGARLAKLSAEQHMCRVLIVGFTLLLFLRIAVGIGNPLGLSTVWKRLAVVCLAAIASWLFYRHLNIRASRLMGNVWHSLDLASKTRAPLKDCAEAPLQRKDNPSKQQNIE